MENSVTDRLNDIQTSLAFFVPELLLCLFLILIITASLFRLPRILFGFFALLCFSTTLSAVIAHGPSPSAGLFGGMLRLEGLSSFMKVLMNVAALLTCLMSLRKNDRHQAEYYCFLVATVLGGHLLSMSNHFLMIFISLELVSIGSYVLAGYSFSKEGSEGSLKYFFFGATASAVMLFGFSLLYGLTGTLDFSSGEFFQRLAERPGPVGLLAGFMALGGFLFKIGAAPMHAWAPDVYHAAPAPVAAFISVAPKMAGLSVLTKFILAINMFGQSTFDWQVITAAIAILTIGVGNFSALRQQSAKRMMAYSSIAQSGFMLIGIAAFHPQGVHFMLFYASIYLLMNFLVFLYLDFFEQQGIFLIPQFAGQGRVLVPSLFLLVGMIALTGLPPTAGFMAKLFIFSGIWEAYQASGKTALIWLLIFGLLNTVVALFFYLRIPYFAFLRNGEKPESAYNLSFEHLLGFLLVFLILLLFFNPELLMGWINKITFVL